MDRLFNNWQFLLFDYHWKRIAVVFWCKFFDTNTEVFVRDIEQWGESTKPTQREREKIWVICIEFSHKLWIIIRSFNTMKCERVWKYCVKTKGAFLVKSWNFKCVSFAPCIEMVKSLTKESIDCSFIQFVCDLSSANIISGFRHMRQPNGNELVLLCN